MTVFFRDGNETGDPTGGSVTRTTSGTVSTVTTPASPQGTNWWSFGTAASYVQEQKTAVLDTDYFIAIRVRLDAAPSALMQLFFLFTAGGAGVCSIRLGTDRRLRLYDSAGSGVGSTSPQLATSEVHIVELHVRVNTAGQGVLGLRVDQQEVTPDTAATVGNTAFNRVRVGNVGAAGTTISALYVDDVRANDSGGGSDNTWNFALAQPPPAPLINPNGNRRLHIPVGVYNVNNSVIRANDHFAAMVFVLDEAITLYRFFMGFRMAGVDTDGSGAGAPAELLTPTGYGDGNGGTIHARLCTLNVNGTPNLSDVLASESVNAVDRYIAAKAAYGGSLTQLFHLGMGDVSLQADVPYAMVIGNSHGSPLANWFSVNSPVCHESIVCAQNQVVLSKYDDDIASIAGLDRRERLMWTTNGGSSWSVGAAVGGPDELLSGYYDGVGGGEDGIRLPWYGYQTASGQPVKGIQPYFAYEATGAFTLTCKRASRTVTLTRAGGYSPADSGGVGVVTVTNVTTSQSGQTASLGTGIVHGALDNLVAISEGDTFTVANSGSVFKAEGDVFVVSTFGVGDEAGHWPFTTVGHGSDRAELFAL